eukprot:CAMPEP_0180253816 /NCGR_PEP_ID=MMETSP0987-20121128/39816_1 /TAXON_ID=697907 /ORGANISM="non described non described, Strain CCMP2293" /LENGTH=67 /DNA_ID=CAMNT_0022222737 /DNA_START=362 /DNA_END=562 /DNA_ORIENTATION=+
MPGALAADVLENEDSSPPQAPPQWRAVCSRRRRVPFVFPRALEAPLYEARPRRVLGALLLVIEHSVL